MCLISGMSILIPISFIQINISVSLLKFFSNKVVLISVFNTEYKIYIIQYIFFCNLAESKDLKYFIILIPLKMLLTKIIVFLIALAPSIFGIKKFRS